MRLVFICSFGGAVGYGHLKRCATLSLHARKSQIDTILLCISHEAHSDSPSALATALLGEFSRSSICHSLSEAVESGLIKNSDVLILDSYDAYPLIELLSERVSNVLSFTDEIIHDLFVSDNTVQVCFSGIDCPERIDPNSPLWKSIDLIPLLPPEVTLARPVEYLGVKRPILVYPGGNGSSVCEDIVQYLQSLYSDHEHFSFFCPSVCTLDIKGMTYISGNKGLLAHIYHSHILITAAGNCLLEGNAFKIPAISFCTHQNQVESLSCIKACAPHRILCWGSQRIDPVLIDDFARDLAAPKTVISRSPLLQLIKLRCK